jgi:hypothetical protein
MINQKHLGAALLSISAAFFTTSASAVTAEVAKKCESLTAKAFPPRQIGNPAAGSAKGTAQDQRAYFNKCVDAGGKVNDSGSGQTK